MAITLTCPNCRQQSSVGEEFAGKNSVCPFCNASLVVPRVSGQAAYGQPAARPKSTSGWVIAVIVLAVSACVLLVCGGVLLALLLPAVNAAREAARRTVCANNEKQIVLAAHNYAATHNNQFPPAAKGRQNPVSWRVELLPFMEQNALYQQYDKAKAWDDPANQAVLNTMPREFKCPSDTSDLPNETSYFMLTGPGTVGGVPGSGGVSLFQIVNGLSRTILIVEVRGLHVPWTKPSDITAAELITRLERRDPTAHVAGFNVGFCDGSVQFKPVGDLNIADLKRMATIDASQPAAAEAGSDNK